MFAFTSLRLTFTVVALSTLLCLRIYKIRLCFSNIFFSFGFGSVGVLKFVTLFSDITWTRIRDERGF